LVSRFPDHVHLYSGHIPHNHTSSWQSTFVIRQQEVSFQCFDPVYKFKICLLIFCLALPSKIWAYCIVLIRISTTFLFLPCFYPWEFFCRLLTYSSPKPIHPAIHYLLLLWWPSAPYLLDFSLLLICSDSIVTFLPGFKAKYDPLVSLLIAYSILSSKCQFFSCFTHFHLIIF
jgi:hypothetical protein